MLQFFLTYQSLPPIQRENHSQAFAQRKVYFIQYNYFMLIKGETIQSLDTKSEGKGSEEGKDKK